MNKPLFKLCVLFIVSSVPFTCQDWVVRVGTLLVVTCCLRPAHLPMQQQQEQQVQFLAALNRFQRLVVLRQHIRDRIMAFDDVTDQWETRADLYDQPTAQQLRTIRVWLHDLCHQIGRELTNQEGQLQGFLQAW